MLNSSRLAFGVNRCFNVPCGECLTYIKPALENFQNHQLYNKKSQKQKEELIRLFAFLALNDKYGINLVDNLGNNIFRFYHTTNRNCNIVCSTDGHKNLLGNHYVAYYNSILNTLYVGEDSQFSFGNITMTPFGKN